MRRKIIIANHSICEKNIYDIISEKGIFKKIVFSTIEIEKLFQTGYFSKVNNELEVSIDLFEEEIICSPQKIVALKMITSEFRNSFINDDNGLFARIEDLIDVAILKKFCIYFIL